LLQGLRGIDAPACEDLLNIIRVMSGI